MNEFYRYEVWQVNKKTLNRKFLQGFTSFEIALKYRARFLEGKNQLYKIFIKKID